MRPLHEAALREDHVELVDSHQVLGLREQQQVCVAASAHQREGLQQVPVSEVLACREQLALVLLAARRLEAPPGGVHLQKGVLHEVARAHAAIIAAAARSPERRRTTGRDLPAGSRAGRDRPPGRGG